MGLVRHGDRSQLFCPTAHHIRDPGLPEEWALPPWQLSPAAGMLGGRTERVAGR